MQQYDAEFFSTTTSMEVLPMKWRDLLFHVLGFQSQGLFRHVGRCRCLDFRCLLVLQLVRWSWQEPPNIPKDKGAQFILESFPALVRTVSHMGNKSLQNPSLLKQPLPFLVSLRPMFSPGLVTRYSIRLLAVRSVPRGGRDRSCYTGASDRPMLLHSSQTNRRLTLLISYRSFF